MEKKTNYNEMIYGNVYQEKFSNLYWSQITNDGKTIYKNNFLTFENAKKALKRNFKNA